MKNIYLTDNIEEIRQRTKNRASKFSTDLEENWKNLEIEITTTKTGEEILVIENLEVMASFQKPYMKKLAEIACSNGGDILNVGFGLGLADTFIESYRPKINEHHIVELNTEVFLNAKKWKASQLNFEKICLHHGNWKDVIPTIKKPFDGILYDAYPLKADELCRDFIPFLEVIIQNKLIKEHTGTITFFLDASDDFGSDFRNWAKKLGIQSMDLQKVNISLPSNRISQTWTKDYFLAPKLSNIIYSQPNKEP